MTITEFAILPFKSPADLSDPALRSLFQKLSDWQSDCSGFPLEFFAKSALESGAHEEIYLVTSWTSIAAHQAWIRGPRNQELLRLFAPYVAIELVRMVHVDVDFEAEPGPPRAEKMVIERRPSASADVEVSAQELGESTWSLVGKDLGQEGGDMYRFVGVGRGEPETVGVVERWVMTRVNLSV